MCRVIAVIAAAAVLGFGTPTASALGFGRVANASLLGQPVDFSVALILDPGESLSAECIGADVLAGDVRIAPANVRVRLEGPLRGPRLVASVRTTVRIVEPVVTVRITAGCTARHTRSFITFIEPPIGKHAPPMLAANPPPLLPAADVRGAEKVAPAASSSAPAASQPEQGWVPEQDLLRAQAEHASAVQSVAALQARVRELEAARRNPPLVYGLATLLVLLLGALVALLWRVVRLSNRLALVAQVHARDSRLVDAAVHMRESELDHTWTQTRVVTEPAPAHAPPPEAKTEPQITTAPAAHTSSHELSVDELIDLEQQADFFIALAQDDAAIDLLMGQLRHSGGSSPMPYLKLLDIYRRRGDVDAHERIRERFNRRFNAHAPASVGDPMVGQSLEAYPEALARLQAAWPTPDEAVALLELLMGRSHGSDPGFDLPAFADLMLLHSVARDLRERETGAGGIDLLLPLAEESRVISGGSGPAPALDLQLP
jgi:hypothetical protein